MELFKYELFKKLWQKANENNKIITEIQEYLKPLGIKPTEEEIRNVYKSIRSN